MSDVKDRESELLHQFANHLSVIVGFCGVLLAELPETDQRHHDVCEISKAADAAMALLPALRARMR
jgi:hypothetical protein